MGEITVQRTITRDAYRAMIEAAGFDPDELISLRFIADGIYAETPARDLDGKWLRDGNAPAVHTIYVQVVG